MLFVKEKMFIVTKTNMLDDLRDLETKGQKLVLIKLLSRQRKMLEFERRFRLIHLTLAFLKFLCVYTDVEFYKTVIKF